MKEHFSELLEDLRRNLILMGGEVERQIQRSIEALTEVDEEKADAVIAADEEIDRMTHLNAMREFTYDPFRYRAREQCTVGALRAEAIGVDIEPRSSARRPKSEREGPVKMTDFSPTA